MTVTVEPGVVLDQLNAWLRPHGLWFPVDVSTSAQATIGGMAGNNSCGSRSIAYGNMVHNVHAIDALLSDGTMSRFGPLADMRIGTCACARIDRQTMRDRLARARRNRAPCSIVAASGRRIQHRCLSSAKRAPLHRRWQREPCASSRGQRRHAGLDAPAHVEGVSAANAPHAGHRQFSDAVPGHGMHASDRRTRAVGGRAGRPDDDRSRARQSGIPTGDRRGPDRRAGSDSPGRVHRATIRGLAASTGCFGYADGRPRRCPAVWCE